MTGTTNLKIQRSGPTHQNQLYLSMQKLLADLISDAKKAIRTGAETYRVQAESEARTIEASMEAEVLKAEEEARKAEAEVAVTRRQAEARVKIAAAEAIMAHARMEEMVIYATIVRKLNERAAKCASISAKEIQTAEDDICRELNSAIKAASELTLKFLTNSSVGDSLKVNASNIAAFGQIWSTYSPKNL